jgi:pyruvate/2-oxoacid:ferredoxin oxidoreductase alpha subunit
MVLVNVSRGLSSPITLEADHNDILSARDSGFLQIHAETCHEILDAILMAYRLAEDERVMLPVLVNLDGFTLSFTREPVVTPAPEAVASFYPLTNRTTRLFVATSLWLKEQRYWVALSTATFAINNTWLKSMPSMYTSKSRMSFKTILDGTMA